MNVVLVARYLPVNSRRCVRGLIGMLAVLWLAGCAMAPGMRASAGSNMPAVTPITPGLIAAQEQSTTVASNELLTTFANPSTDYRIGAADVLAIGVLNHPELVPPDASGSREGGEQPFGFVVDAAGNLDYPYVGKLAVAGKSVDQVRSELSTMLARYIQQPQPSVRITGFRSQRVYVDGAVHSPGSRVMTDVPMTLALALAESGGIAPNGDASHVSIQHQGHIYHVDLPALANAGNGAESLYLHDQDRVQVRDRIDHPVFVAGEVGQPKPVPMRDGSLTLGDALAQAGSMSQVGSNPRGVYVVRLEGRAATPLVFQLDAKSPAGLALAGRFPLRPNDLVYVETAGLMRWNRVMNLLLSSSISLYNTQRAVDGP
ncbi:MAG: polysaccharide biosynthesis/export family protein [Rhodanobacter sp.]